MKVLAKNEIYSETTLLPVWQAFQKACPTYLLDPQNKKEIDFIKLAFQTDLGFPLEEGKPFEWSWHSGVNLGSLEFSDKINLVNDVAHRLKQFNTWITVEATVGKSHLH